MLVLHAPSAYTRLHKGHTHRLLTLALTKDLAMPGYTDGRLLVLEQHCLFLFLYDLDGRISSIYFSHLKHFSRFSWKETLFKVKATLGG